MEIKTSKEVLDETKKKLIPLLWSEEHLIREAMKIFAQQFIELAYESAKIKEYSSKELNEMPLSYRTTIENYMGDTYALDPNSILKLKQLIK